MVARRSIKPFRKHVVFDKKRRPETNNREIYQGGRYAWRIASPCADFACNNNSTTTRNTRSQLYFYLNFLEELRRAKCQEYRKYQVRV